MGPNVVQLQYIEPFGVYLKTFTTNTDLIQESSERDNIVKCFQDY